MTRYCAAPCCKNRGGQLAGTPRRVSFYPFPLHDKGRLQEWLRNMKQSKWYPSKHQVLCSDHFTPESFNIRWGIRYLKPNAIPTIFSFSPSFQEQFHLQPNGNPEEGKRDTVCSDLNDFCHPTKNSLTHDIQASESSVIGFKSLYSKNMMDGFITSTETSKELHCLQAKQDYNIPTCQIMTSNLRQTPLGSLFVSTVGDLPSKDEMCFEVQATTQDDMEEHLSTLHLEGNQQPNKESLVLSTIKQTIEKLNTPKPSVITIIIPDELSEEQSVLARSVISDNPQLTSIETLALEKDSDSGNESSEMEHSYCKQGFDRDHLWEKIGKLQSKIALLEVQENATLCRLKSLEALIRRLRQENVLSEEKLKIVENCCNSFEIAML
ncbi:THAP domain-containing protein 5 [Rhinophrynus dorsalis]